MHLQVFFPGCLTLLIMEYLDEKKIINTQFEA